MLTRKEIGFGAWITYLPQWLSVEDADAAMSVLHSELNWQEREIIAKRKRVMQPRLMSWAGELPYLYSGQVLEPQSMHPLLAQLGVQLSEQCGVKFNHVVANLYRDGRDRVGFHADDEPELGYEPVIASVSLGATRRFVFKYKYL